MDNRTFYTAVGNLRRKTEGFGQTYSTSIYHSLIKTRHHVNKEQVESFYFCHSKYYLE